MWDREENVYNLFSFPVCSMNAVLALLGDRLRGCLRGFRRQGRVARASALFEALAGEGAHIAQSSTYAYLRARTGFMAPKLFSEKMFLEALEVTRWEAFAAVLADLFVITEGALRPHSAAGATRLPVLLAAAFDAELARHPAPAHREGGWSGLAEALETRLREAQTGPVRASDAIAASAGRHIFEFLPLHPDMLRLDEDLVVNSVRFRTMSGWQKLIKRCDFAAIAVDLFGSAEGDLRVPVEGEGRP